jgi:uncharacterized protein (DUF433 family)
MSDTEHPHPYAEAIVRDPAVRSGQPTFRGTRVLLRTILSYLAQGRDVDAILAEFPTLTPEHVRAAIAFAAASAAEDIPSPRPDPLRPTP